MAPSHLELSSTSAVAALGCSELTLVKLSVQESGY